MAEETIFQHWIFSKFILPFALIVALVYAVLEKTKLLGEDKHQLNAIIAFVIGLLFTGFVYPTLVIQNMILFLTVALVILFVILLLWGFIFGDKDKFEMASWMKWILGVGVGIASVFAILWATGIHDKVIGYLFQQSWSNVFWTNFLFVIVIAVALALVLKNKAGAGK
ncbi:hypothetical protein DRN69_02300 [Candidatus Pacearchaeota archaeon]|nr:MAG: hypothetical protein DRN69_02300 [Candidatus Pacearchaeota archaeon]